MKPGRGILFNVLCALSLAVAVTVAVAWVKSFQKHSTLFSFNSSGETYRFKSRWGQFVLLGPPADKTQDPAAAEDISRMSNADFDWARARFRDGLYALGEVRDGTPTARVFKRLRQRQRLEPALRTWLRETIDDPQRFAAAQMSLILIAGERADEYFVFRNRMESRFCFRADSSGSAPDFSQRTPRRAHWQDLLDVPRLSIFHGWVVLGALILPLAWITRPRAEVKTRRRWLLNGLTLVLAIVCIASTAMGVRSHWVDEEWAFAPRPPRPVAGWPDPAYSKRWIASFEGQLVFLELDAMDDTGFDLPLGYTAGRPSGVSLRPVLMGFSMGKKRHWGMPGIDYDIVAPPVSATAVTRPTVGLWSIRSLAISWWLLTIVSAILPLLWAGRATIEWRRRRRQRLMSAKLCIKCGYDMRATPGQCPECGSLAATSGV